MAEASARSAMETHGIVAACSPGVGSLGVTMNVWQLLDLPWSGGWVVTEVPREGCQALSASKNSGAPPGDAASSSPAITKHRIEKLYCVI